MSDIPVPEELLEQLLGAGREGSRRVTRGIPIPLGPGPGQPATFGTGGQGTARLGGLQGATGAGVSSDVLEQLRRAGPTAGRGGARSTAGLGPSTTPVTISGTTGGTAGQAAGQAGGVRGLAGQASGALGRIPFPQGRLARGAVGLGTGIAGQALSSQVGGQESALGRFTSGAGIGAGFGAFGGAKGMVIGGLLGGLGNMIFGGGQEASVGREDAEATLTEAMGHVQLSPDARQEILGTFGVLWTLAESDEDKKAALDQAGQMILRSIGQDRAAQQNLTDMLALQTQAQDFMRPFAQQQLDAAMQRAAFTEQFQDQLPASFRPIAQHAAASSMDHSSRVASAYATQAQLIPGLAALRLAQQQQAQAAQQQFSSQLGGGAGDLQDLIGELTAAGSE